MLLSPHLSTAVALLLVSLLWSKVQVTCFPNLIVYSLFCVLCSCSHFPVCDSATFLPPKAVYAQIRNVHYSTLLETQRIAGQTQQLL